MSIVNKVISIYFNFPGCLEASLIFLFHQSRMQNHDPQRFSKKLVHVPSQSLLLCVVYTIICKLEPQLKVQHLMSFEFIF